MPSPAPFVFAGPVPKIIPRPAPPQRKIAVPVKFANRRRFLAPDASSSDSGESSQSESDETPANTLSPDKECATNPLPEMSSLSVKSMEEETMRRHMELLQVTDANDEASEIETAPLFTMSVKTHVNESLKAKGVKSRSPFVQYGLLAGDISQGSQLSADQDPRIFYNTATPSSTFICGSQGSGKSHTLSTILENCLTQSEANVLPRPLTGVVFHYDTFSSDTGGAPCEAAFLASNKKMKVRVLCPPTNYIHIKRVYAPLTHVTVEEFRIKQTDLNTERMLEMMAVSSGTGSMPLYLHVVVRILRELRIDQQQKGGRFQYARFKEMLEAEELTEAQLAPLKQRLDTLESFLVKSETDKFQMTFSSNAPGGRGGRGASRPVASPRDQLLTDSKAEGNDWTPRAGQLTIVDLSCPCVTAEMACSLFNIALHLFIEGDSKIGRVIALDEAHKYMTDTAECQALTDTLLATIRLQRHIAARVVISTQEPTISPKLLDLCSTTIVHRFTSPDWLSTLSRHLAGASGHAAVKDLSFPEQGDGEEEVVAAAASGYRGIGSVTLDPKDTTKDLFAKIVALRTGEALVFAPSAIIGTKTRELDSGSLTELVGLGNGVLKVRVRKRVTQDGGRSIMAN